MQFFGQQMKSRSTSTSPSDLTAHLGYWLRMVSNHVSNEFARKVDAEGATVAEWVLLRRLLESGPSSPSRIAETMGATRGTVTKLADRLIGKGLVVRRADASDGRAQFLRLTPRGRKLVPRLAELADRNDAEFFGHLGASQRKALQGALQDIVERRGLTAPPID